jgi:hypothetical protein
MFTGTTVEPDMVENGDLIFAETSVTVVTEHGADVIPPAPGLSPLAQDVQALSGGDWQP